MAPKQLRPIRVEGNIAYISLTRGYEAVIDAADVPLVEGFSWFASVGRENAAQGPTVYAARTGAGLRPGTRRAIYMHRAIMAAFDPIEVDHRDGDGLNNRRGNLRPATRAQNARNTAVRSSNKAGVKGVCYSKANKGWVAQITTDGVNKNLGTFQLKSDAQAAYDAAAREMHGEFARTSDYQGSGHRARLARGGRGDKIGGMG
jgi:hypothetical protein